MAQKRACGLSPEKRMLVDRGALPKEDADLTRDYKAMHEEHFLSGWLRDDTQGKAEEVKEWNRKDQEEEAKGRKREVEEGGEWVAIDGTVASFNCQDKI